MKTYRFFAALAGLTTLSATTALATSLTVNVDAHANGFFGHSFSLAQSTDMIRSISLTAGETVDIIGTGQIAIGEQIFVGPNGEDTHSNTGKVFAFEYTPLEEAIVDANPAHANDPLMPKLGALIGAFVARSTVDATGFLARDTDVGGGIASTDLFFVGESLSYTAAFDGTLFFGINEAYVQNNSLMYSASLTVDNGFDDSAAVPLPAGLPMLASALGLGELLRRRRKA